MRWARAIRTGILNLLILAILVMAIEISVRWLHPEIPPQHSDVRLFDPHKYDQTYGYKPFAIGEELGAIVSTDEHGFRISSYSAQRNLFEQILLLGDSVSVGIGVEAEQTYPSLLEERLAKKVVNASVTGYGFVDYVAVLGNIVNQFTPELIILGICLNDIVPTSQANIVTINRYNKADGEDTPHEKRYPNRLVRTMRYFNDNVLNFHKFFGSYSRAYVFLKSFATDSARDHFAADKSYYRDPTTIEFLSSQFEKLKSLTEGKPLLLLIFPYEYQLRVGSSSETLEPQQKIKEAGRRTGLTVYDLSDDLNEYLRANNLSSRSIYLFNDPMHFNSLGHHAIAEILNRLINRI